MVGGKVTEAALYLLRKGSVHLKAFLRSVEMEEVGFFGEDMLTLDARTGKGSPSHPTTLKAPYTVQATTDAVLVKLTLADCRKVFDTTYLGKGKPKHSDSIKGKSNLHLNNFKRHTILGAGTFGQVWLVSRQASFGQRRVYALKIQSMYELTKSHQAKGVVQEKEIMSKLHHPFVCGLVASFKVRFFTAFLFCDCARFWWLYIAQQKNLLRSSCAQDDTFVYMLLELIQGGELEGLMRNEERDFLSDKEACFYAAGIADALFYMNRNGYVYRDLKPQNVLISNQGYPVVSGGNVDIVCNCTRSSHVLHSQIADFGFAKVSEFLNCVFDGFLEVKPSHTSPCPNPTLVTVRESQDLYFLWNASVFGT